MTELHRNFIAGEWVEGEAVPDINPSNTNDVVGDYARASAGDADRRDRRRQGGLPRLVALGHPAAPRHPQGGLRRDPGAARGDRPAAVARGRQDACRRHRRDGARRPDLRLLRRRGAAAHRRDRAERPARRRRRDDARGRSASSASSRRGISRSPSPPGRSRRRSAYGNTVVFKPADLVPGSAWAIVDILVRAGLPKGVLNLVMGRGSVVGEAMLDSPDVNAITFTGSVQTGRKVAAASRRSTCASSSSRWAARTRWSCSTTPTSRSRSSAPPMAPFSRPASAARPPRA